MKTARIPAADIAAGEYTRRELQTPALAV